MPTLAELKLRQIATIEAVGGDRGFRRRLLEMGLIPGAQVSIVNVAPLGDPFELEVRHGRLSIRRFEAAQIQVRDAAAP